MIALLQGRDEQAIKEMNTLYGKRLYGIAYRILENEQDAEECVNDTLLKVWNAVPPAKPDMLSAYLAKICRNIALDRLERRKADKRSANVIELSEELSQCVPDQIASNEMEARLLTHALENFLEKLPKRGRGIFLRRYWLGESVKEIAQHYGIKETTVKTTLFRLRKRLRKYLEKEDFII